MDLLVDGQSMLTSVYLQHVLVEKPISIDLETSRQVVRAAEQRPDLKVMVGFSRRCE